MRSNIDPFNQHSDEKIVEALKKVTIWDQIKPDGEQIDNPKDQDPQYLISKLSSEDKEKLYMNITTGGGNFSLG